MSRVSENISTLIRTEIALNKAKAAETGKRFGLGAGLLGAAGVFALFGLGYLLTTLSQVIALWLPKWAGSLIVAVLVLIVAGVLALVGKKEIDNAYTNASVSDVKLEWTNTSGSMWTWMYKGTLTGTRKKTKQNVNAPFTCDVAYTVSSKSFDAAITVKGEY